MPVAERHRQRAVSEQIFHFLQAGTALNSPGRERVTQVVKVEVDQPGAIDRTLPGRAEVVALSCAEHETAVLGSAPGEDGISTAVQRHLTPLAALRNVPYAH
jgi:hypothetical protein